jgi:hypothetical protein
MTPSMKRKLKGIINNNLASLQVGQRYMNVYADEAESANTEIKGNLDSVTETARADLNGTFPEAAVLTTAARLA